MSPRHPPFGLSAPLVLTLIYAEASGSFTNTARTLPPVQRSALLKEIPAEIRGRWVVRRLVPTTTISCWSQRDADRVIGSELEYAATTFWWEKKLTTSTGVTVRRVTAEQFQTENSGGGTDGSYVDFRQLGISATEVTMIAIAHPPAEITGATVEVPGDEVLVKDADTLVFSVCGLYFEAKRVSGRGRFGGL